MRRAWTAWRTGFTTPIRLAVAGGAVLAMLGCAGLYNGDDRPPPVNYPREVIPSPSPSAAHRAPPAPTRPAPSHPIPGLTASTLVYQVTGVDQITAFIGVPWICADQPQPLSDGQRGYHCTAAGNVHDLTGTLLFEVGVTGADQVGSVYLAALGAVPKANGDDLGEEEYLSAIMGLLADNDPAMLAQFSDEPLDTPTSDRAGPCATTDVPVKTATAGPLLLQWGACSGDWSSWYTLRVTAR
jgi:hypothetical protein